jgi:hypothetical protein
MKQAFLNQVITLRITILETRDHIIGNDIDSITPHKFNKYKLTVSSSMLCLIKLVILNYLLYILSILISYTNSK